MMYFKRSDLTCYESLYAAYERYMSKCKSEDEIQDLTQEYETCYELLSKQARLYKKGKQKYGYVKFGNSSNY